MWMLLALLIFDPAAARQKLADPPARLQILAAFEDLSRGEVEAARAEGLAAPIAALVAAPTTPVAERILAVRALGRLGGEAAIQALAPLLSGPAGPEGTAVAREAAGALARMGAAEALAPALAASDPELRATAAGAGAAPAQLCARLSDAWPEVRIAAARGLAHHPDQAACLGPALSDRDPRVQAAAARAASAVKNPTLVAPLRALAGNAKAALDARAEAFVALGVLGDFEPAERALAAHLSQGGIEALAEAAIQALASRGNPADRDRVRAALASPTPVVRAAAARALALLGDQASIPAIRAQLQATPAQHRAVLQQALETLGEPSPEADPAAADPE